MNYLRVIRRADQSLIETLEWEIEMMWIHSQGVHNRRLQVIDVNWVFGRRIAKRVRLTISPGLNASAGHPHRKTVWVVAAAQKL